MSRRHTCDVYVRVIVNEPVFAAAISLSRDGSQGDRVQLEENHQQHQGCVRLQRGPGLVSMSAVFSEILCCVLSQKSVQRC